VRQLLHLIVEKAIASMQVQLALDRRNGRQFAKNDASHGK
jgi:hypothetical protein